MASMNGESKETDQNVTAMAKEQEERILEMQQKDTEIQELKAKIAGLQRNSKEQRQKMRELLICSQSALDKEDTIDDLEHQIKNLQSLSQDNKKLRLENDNLKASLKEKATQVVESEQQMKQSIDDLNKHNQRLQSEVEIIFEGNKKLQLENDNLKQCLSQKETELVESDNKCKQLQQIIDSNSVEFPVGQLFIIKQPNEQVEEEMPLPGNSNSHEQATQDNEVTQTETTNDSRTEPEVIILSDDEEPEEKFRPQDSSRSQQPIQEQVTEVLEPIQEGGLEESTPEDAIQKEFQESNDVESGHHSEEEDLGDEPMQEERLEKSSPEDPIQEEFQEFNDVEGGNHSDGEEGLEEEEEEEEEEQEEDCEDASSEEDSDEDSTLENRVFLKPNKTKYTVGEIEKIIDYIFNVYKPLPPKYLSFGVKYWQKLSEKLSKSKICTRTMNSLRLSFAGNRIYELYKSKKLNTAEHRRIAVEAFKRYGGKFAQKLTDQYDKARLPGTTDRQIDRRKSLIGKNDSYKLKRPAKRQAKISKLNAVGLLTRKKFTRKLFTPDEDDKLIDVIFNVVEADLSEDRKNKPYWEEVSKFLVGGKRASCEYKAPKERFRYILLPTLHRRMELNSPKHRRIAIECYNLWCGPKVQKFIRLYDSARVTSQSTYQEKVREGNDQIAEFNDIESGNHSEEEELGDEEEDHEDGEQGEEEQEDEVESSDDQEESSEESDEDSDSSATRQAKLSKLPFRIDHKMQRFTPKEDKKLIDLIFNVVRTVVPEDRLKWTYWKEIGKKLVKSQNQCFERPFRGLKNRFQYKLLPTLHRRRELNSRKHRQIAIECYNLWCRDNVQELTRQYDSARSTAQRTNQNETTEENDQEETTERHDKEDNNNVDDNDNENEVGEKRAPELAVQDDEARQPDTTDEQIGQMESLTGRTEAEASRRPTRQTAKPFTNDEDDRIIELAFSIEVESPEERKSNNYWDRITDELSEYSNNVRKLEATRGRFQNKLLPGLYRRSELKTWTHRRIAVELYTVWYPVAIRDHHIHLYDTTRKTKRNLKIIHNEIYE